jgi:hypothetical protein
MLAMVLDPTSENPVYRWISNNLERDHCLGTCLGRDRGSSIHGRPNYELRKNFDRTTCLLQRRDKWPESRHLESTLASVATCSRQGQFLPTRERNQGHRALRGLGGGCAQRSGYLCLVPGEPRHWDTANTQVEPAPRFPHENKFEWKLRSASSMVLRSSSEAERLVESPLLIRIRESGIIVETDMRRGSQ